MHDEFKIVRVKVICIHEERGLGLGLQLSLDELYVQMRAIQPQTLEAVAHGLKAGQPIV